MENKIWILLWYIGLVALNLLLIWMFGFIGNICLKRVEKKVKRKQKLYRKYGMVYKYKGVLKDVISYD